MGGKGFIWLGYWNIGKIYEFNILFNNIKKGKETIRKNQWDC